ncbi:hypothetical protein EJ110_NYTH22768 [Nymphaea thermarum]|nr:hypothetical protein EJ110_NYTH22768 [Nymphaea thermarum]
MPLFLSVGPYYASNAHTLEDTVLNLVLERTQISSPKDVVNALRNDELEVRECYQGASSPFSKLADNDEFVKLLVRGGCFVDAHHDNNGTPPLHHQHQTNSPWPFFNVSIATYIDPPFQTMHLTQTFEVLNLAGACHLLDAARMKLLPMMRCSLGNRSEMSVRYSAIDLEDSGITISPAAEGMVIWDPRPAWKPFLKLQCILINRDSDYIFRNMVAYEQRLAEDDNHPVQLAFARVLTFQGIIDNQLGSLEVVVNLVKDLELRDTYGIYMMSKVQKDINTHCERKGISREKGSRNGLI